MPNYLNPAADVDLLERKVSWLKHTRATSQLWQSQLYETEQDYQRLRTHFLCTTSQQSRVSRCGERLRSLRSWFRRASIRRARMRLPKDVRLSIAAFMRSRR